MSSDNVIPGDFGRTRPADRAGYRVGLLIGRLSARTPLGPLVARGARYLIARFSL